MAEPGLEPGTPMIFRHVPSFTVERRWLPLSVPKLNLLRIGGLELSGNARSGHGVVVPTGEMLTKRVRDDIGAA